jgi:hypothetical protein
METDRKWPARIASVLVGVTAWGILAWNTAAPSDHRKFKWRYWVDVVAATRLYLDHRLGDPLANAGDEDIYVWAKRSIESQVDQIGIQQWQWWRLIGLKRFIAVRERLALVPDSEDPGRAWALALGFRVLGGVSPFLLLWLGAFLALPVLVWTSFELFEAGWPVAGTVFPMSVASLPFVVECLALPYSAVGFYVVALVAIVPMAAYGILGRPTPTGVLIRVLLAGLLFAGCALCRSDTLGLLPGWMLAIAAAARRAALGRQAPSEARLPGGGRGVMLVVSSIACFVMPYVIVRPSAHHAVWTAVWEGLGDFDQTKGHAWSDRAARQALQNAGLVRGAAKGFLVVPPEGEIFFRRSVLKDITSNPGWYVAILAQRAFATIMQRTPWQWRPIHATTNYDDKTTRVNFVGFRNWRWELPVPLLMLPSAMLFCVWGIAAMRGHTAASGMAGGVGVLVCLAVEGLGVPVLISIAGGLETEAFLLTYVAGVALALDLARRPTVLGRLFRRVTRKQGHEGLAPAQVGPNARS